MPVITFPRFPYQVGCRYLILTFQIQFNCMRLRKEEQEKKKKRWRRRTREETVVDSARFCFVLFCFPKFLLEVRFRNKQMLVLLVLQTDGFWQTHMLLQNLTLLKYTMFHHHRRFRVALPLQSVSPGEQYFFFFNIFHH